MRGRLLTLVAILSAVILGKQINADESHGIDEAVLSQEIRDKIKELIVNNSNSNLTDPAKISIDLGSITWSHEDGDYLDSHSLYFGFPEGPESLEDEEKIDGEVVLRKRLPLRLSCKRRPVEVLSRGSGRNFHVEWCEFRQTAGGVPRLQRDTYQIKLNGSLKYLLRDKLRCDKDNHLKQIPWRIAREYCLE